MKFPIMLCVIIYSSISIAQNYTHKLTGYSIDLHDQDTLADTILSIEDVGNITITNNKEKYTFSNLYNGATCRIRASHLSCNIQTINTTINENAEQTINMQHHLEELGEVSINSKTHKNTGNTTVISQFYNEDIQVNNTSTLADAFNQLNGVSSLNARNTIVKPTYSLNNIF